jgi:hypothetical protein
VAGRKTWTVTQGYVHIDEALRFDVDVLDPLEANDEVKRV